MWAGPVLPEIEALPGPQIESGLGDRDRDRGRRQDRPDMRGHVVWPFGGVSEDGVPVGDQPGEVAFEVGTDARIGVLADDQRGAGVVDEHRAEPASDARLADDARDLAGDLEGAPA